MALTHEQAVEVARKILNAMAYDSGVPICDFTVAWEVEYLAQLIILMDQKGCQWDAGTIDLMAEGEESEREEKFKKYKTIYRNMDALLDRMFDRL